MSTMTKVSLAMAMVVLLMAVSVMAGDEPSWFDMENCDFCKNLTADPDLLPNLTWEHHVITNGFISVTTVKPEKMESYATAMKGMEETNALKMKGEKVEMCNFCQAYGGLMMAGVVMDNVTTMHGDVMIMTSDKPEVVTKIKEFAQRTIDEFKKMETAEAHEGHNH